MANEAKEMERTMGNIVQLLHDANTPAKGLATAFGDFTANSKSMEVIMRLASGTGLWRFLNKIKAVGISVAEWNKNAAEARKRTSEMYGDLSKQLQVYRELQTVQQDLSSAWDDVNEQRMAELKLVEKLNDEQEFELTQLNRKKQLYESDIMQGLTALYGAEHARNKLIQDTNDSLAEQTRKVQNLRKLGSSEELLKSITGRKTLKGEQKKFRTGDDDYQRAVELRRRGLGRIETGRKGWHGFVEHGPVKKFLMTRWRGLANIGTQVGKFVMGLSKMIKAYFLGALTVLGNFLMWGAVIVLAVILLKPVFIAIWEAIKEHGPALLEKMKVYYENLKDICFICTLV